MGKIKARKIDVLEWMMKKGIIHAYELEEHFGFSEYYSHTLLTRLKRAGLVDNMTKGYWELTEEGFRKLKYYGRR